MKKKTLQDLRSKSVEDLERELKNERSRLNNLGMDLAMGKVTNIKEIRETKRNIAQLITLIKEKQNHDSVKLHRRINVKNHDIK